jgi:4'-phosphopantetheinyl transferase
MADPGWLTRSLAEVPPSDEWLSRRERETLAALRVPKRRADWRLGRWAAKSAVGAWLGQAPSEVEIAAAADGAPEALVAGARDRVAVSLSHRAGRALALVGEAGTALGCDLEVTEPRSGAFMREWLTPAEQRLVATAVEPGRTRIVNALWTAKEAAAKAQREGLRLDLRQIAVVLDSEGVGGDWQALTAQLMPVGTVAEGWWREEPGWVMAVVAAPPTPPPVRL